MRDYYYYWERKLFHALNHMVYVGICTFHTLLKGSFLFLGSLTFGWAPV